MIHTRKTIFKTLLKRIRELIKHANSDPKEFKKIMMAVILNDLKEWSEYIPKDDPNLINDLLENYILNNCFIVERFSGDDTSYVNVNTPQTNSTWKRIWDIGIAQTGTPEQKQITPSQWTPDDTCDIKLVYFYIDYPGISPKAYLERIYGEHGENLKTICDKMNIFIDRASGEAWYLDTNNEWQPIGATGKEGMTREQVEQLIASYKVANNWSNDGKEIEFTLTKDQSADNTLDVITAEDVEEMV